MKVGIYTIHKDNNFGAMLQAYATQYIIRSFGIDAEVVNYYPIEKDKINNYIGKNNSLKSIIKNIYAIINPQVWLKSKRFNDFHNSMSLSPRYESLDAIYQNPPEYDIHIVGSDQVWNLERGMGKRNYYFLDFLKHDEKRISYASSFGNTNISPTFYPYLRQFLSKFSAISVREDSGVELVKKTTGLDAVQVLDPTLLLSERQWQELCVGRPIVKGKYILYYGFDKNEKCKQMINTLRNALKMPVVALSVSTTIPYKVDRFIQSAGPREFLNLFKNASYIITTSFHGLAFAVNFQKDFVVMRYGTRMSRMESLLDILNLQGRIVSSTSELENLIRREKHIDYNKNNSIEQARQYSIDWLKKALEKG